MLKRSQLDGQTLTLYAREASLGLGRTIGAVRRILAGLSWNDPRLSKLRRQPLHDLDAAAQSLAGE